MFLNDLATGIKDLNCGIEIDTGELSILQYADDIVLMAPSVKNLQKMLNFVAEWCQKWRMAINIDKTKVVHFRNKCVNRTMYKFSLVNSTLEPVSQYKYLGGFFSSLV